MEKAPALSRPRVQPLRLKWTPVLLQAPAVQMTLVFLQALTTWHPHLSTLSPALVGIPLPRSAEEREELPPPRQLLPAQEELCLAQQSCRPLVLCEF